MARAVFGSRLTAGDCGRRCAARASRGKTARPDDRDRRFWCGLGGRGGARPRWASASGWFLAQRPTCSPPTGEGDCFRVAGDALYYHVKRG